MITRSDQLKACKQTAAGLNGQFIATSPREKIFKTPTIHSYISSFMNLHTLNNDCLPFQSLEQLLNYSCLIVLTVMMVIFLKQNKK